MANKEIRHIIRIVNTDLDGNTPIHQALRKIKGVDASFAHAVCKAADVDMHVKAGLMDDKDIAKLEQVIANPGNHGVPEWMLNRRKDYETGADIHKTGVDLGLAREADIKRMTKTRSFRGMRLAWGLPVRGQRTRSNFRPNKGKVVGVRRKKGVKSGRV